MKTPSAFTSASKPPADADNTSSNEPPPSPLMLVLLIPQAIRMVMLAGLMFTTSQCLRRGR